MIEIADKLEELIAARDAADADLAACKRAVDAAIHANYEATRRSINAWRAVLAEEARRAIHA